MRVAVLALAAVSAGCVGRSRPLPPAAEEVTAASVGRTYAAALRAVTDLGLPLRMADHAGGVIETDYVDIAAYDPLAQQYPAPERLVRFRVILLSHDAGPESSRLTVFAIYAPFREARGTSRQGERPIPRDHPGMALVRRIVADVRRATGGG